MADIKWSAFPSTTGTTAGDSVVGLHSGANERFLVTATPAASGLAVWDANKNLSANNFLSGYHATATAAATTTLLVGSAYQQYFTGVTTQTVLLPVTSTLVLGQSFYIVNNSTGVVTVQSSGANTIQAMAAGSTLLVTVILVSGTTAASWNAEYVVNADVSGAVLLAPAGVQTITNYGLIVPSLECPTFLDSNGATILTMTPVASAVNYYTFVNQATGKNPLLEAVGADTNISFALVSKGVAPGIFETQGTSNQYYFVSGTAYANTAILNFPNAVGPYVYTLPAATGTIALTSGASGIVNSGTAGQLTYYAGTGTTVSGATTGTGVITALGVNTGTAGAFVVNGGALGTPSSGTLTNASGLPIAGTTGYGTGVATALAANVTGSGAIVLANAPTFVTGTVTAPSFTPNTTSGIIGTTTNDSAAAGSVGEKIISIVDGTTPFSLSTTTQQNVTSISLTAGDWDVWGNITFQHGAGTTVNFALTWIDSTSATIPNAAYYNGLFLNNAVLATNPGVIPPSRRFSLSGATTIYMSTYCDFAVSTLTACGGIYARRRR